MKNNNNNLTSAVKRNRHDDGAKIAMMANDIAVTRVTSEKLHMYQDKHDDMLYHTIINLTAAPEHNANDTFTIDGKMYNFTASGYEAVLKRFDTIRRKLEEAQVASEKLPGMKSAYAHLISEVLGINTEDVTNVDAAKMEGDNMKEKYKYIVIETDKEPDTNTVEELRKALSSANAKIFDVEINNNGLTTDLIGVVTTSHNKALKIVLDYLNDDGMPSFKEFHESGMVSDLGYSERWRVGDINITSNEGVISRLTKVVLIDKDCRPTKLSASEPEPGHLTQLLDEENHCCNNCNDKGNKEVCQGCVDCEEGVQPLEPSNNCDGDKAEPSSDASPEDTTTPPQTATVKQVSIPVGYPEASVPMMKPIDVPDIEALDVNTGDIGLNLTTGDMTDISGNITFNVSGDIIIDSFNGGRNNTNCK